MVKREHSCQSPVSPDNMPKCCREPDLNPSLVTDAPPAITLPLLNQKPLDLPPARDPDTQQVTPNHSFISHKSLMGLDTPSSIANQYPSNISCAGHPDTLHAAFNHDATLPPVEHLSPHRSPPGQPDLSGLTRDTSPAESPPTADRSQLSLESHCSATDYSLRRSSRSSKSRMPSRFSADEWDLS